MNVEFTEITFDNKSTAAEALKELRQWHQSGVVKVFNAAVLVKDKQGKVSIKEIVDVDAQRGGLIGLVDGAPGAIVHTVAGADMGGMAARLINFGFPNESLRDLQDSLQPGSSALVLVIEPLRIYGAVEDLAHWGGRLFRYTLKTGLANPKCLRIPSGFRVGSWKNSREEDRLSRTPLGGHEGMKIESFNASQCEGD